MPAKKIRARVIAEYVRIAEYAGVVCFSCGNASQALREAGLYTVDVSPSGDMEARRWWKMEEIRRAWPHLFDATSGHLPMPLMVRIAEAFRLELGQLGDNVYEVPTGSGETITCLRLAYPNKQFVAIYNLDRATQYQPEAPLNMVVQAMCDLGLSPRLVTA